MMNKEEQLMRKYHYGYIHSKKLLNEPYVKDLQQRIDKAKEILEKTDYEYSSRTELFNIISEVTETLGEKE